SDLNLQLCFPQMSEQELQALARQSLIETSKTAAEAGAVWRRDYTWLKSKMVEISGEEILRGELAKQQGLLVLAPHHGNWEVVAPYLASIAPLTAMYQPLKRSEEHTSELQSRENLVCRLLLEKKKK